MNDDSIHLDPGCMRNPLNESIFVSADEIGIVRQKAPPPDSVVSPGDSGIRRPPELHMAIEILKIYAELSN